MAALEAQEKAATSAQGGSVGQSGSAGREIQYEPELQGNVWYSLSV